MTSAVGVWFYCDYTKRYLYVMRRDVKHPDAWGLPGGKVDQGESLLEAIHRECREELGVMPDHDKIMPIEKYTSMDGQFTYHTFFCIVSHEFRPQLNGEHRGYAWIDCDTWPRPMHPGLWNTVNFQEIADKMSVLRRAD